MQPYQAGFIEFLVRSGVLTFGDFITKSGRPTPFFINAGRFDSGMKMRRLGAFYAEALWAALGEEFDCLYGPAYKGIPLAVALAMALAERGRDVPFTFNRKEAKDHGEGGSLIGHRLADGERVVIVEDVTTAGTSVRETMEIFKAAAAVDPVALIVAVDRQERGQGEQNALAELAETYGLKTIAIVTLDQIVEHLHNRPLDGRVVVDDAALARIEAYRAQYGAKT
jgi:orotate phosphoribosyltransferase